MVEPLVFGHGVAAVAFRVAISSWAVFEVAMQVRQRRRAPRRPGRDWTGVVLTGCLAGAVIAAVRLGRDGPLEWPGGQLWPVVAGLALVAAGVGLRAWSIATLGRFFQYRIEVQPDHEVVTDGPYRWVRHPSYTGLALVIVGLALATGDVLGAAIALVLTAAGLAIRIRAEERQLTGALGDRYERFASGRKRLVPGVW